MNKYKLVPYLVLSKEDAQLEKMQDELATILNDKTIDDATKLALYEDLLNKINCFKETISKKSVVHLQLPPPPPKETTTVATQAAEEPSHHDDNGQSLVTTEDASRRESQDSSPTILSQMGSEDEDTRPFITPHRRRPRSTQTTPQALDQNPSSASVQQTKKKSSTRANRQPSSSGTSLNHSVSHTRSGASYADPTRIGNRPLGKTTQWVRDPWKN